MRNGTAKKYSTVPFWHARYTGCNRAVQATGVEPTLPFDSDGAACIVLKETSTGTVARRRGTCETIAGKAPDGVGKSVTSPFLALRPRKARNAQKHIQAKSTPRSVQEKIICVNVMVADVFMGTSFFTCLKEIFSDVDI
jgi:hypothetical protein